MIVKVIKEFVDKHSGQLHELGSTFECSEERFKEIKDAGSFVEPAPILKKAEKVTE